MTGTHKWVLPFLVVAALVLAVASPASAVSAARKLAALSDFTQTSVGSYRAWDEARLDQHAWVGYRFNWSTDYCSSSPDIPLGFDFRLSCHRHDFGYRNYKEMGMFPAHKSRVDDAFYADLKRKCTGYHWLVRPACYSLAWTYYQAVKSFGTTAAVTPADIQRARELMPAA